MQVTNYTQAELSADMVPMIAALATRPGETVYYCEVVDLLRDHYREKYVGGLSERYKVFHEALGDVSKRSLERDGFALSSSIVNKGTSEPGLPFKG